MDELGCGLDDQMVAAVTVLPGGTGPVGNFAKTVASNLVGAGVTPKPIPKESVTEITGRSAEAEAQSATQDEDYRHGDFVAALASRCASCGFAGATGPRS